MFYFLDISIFRESSDSTNRFILRSPHTQEPSNLVRAGLVKINWRRDNSSDITFLRKSQWLVKRHSYFMQAVCTCLWI